MKDKSIVISNNHVAIAGGLNNIWLTQHQIADLFGVFVGAVNSNIRSIFKSGILREQEATRIRKNGKGQVTVYNLEMVTALAFRLKSPLTGQFRRWMIRQAVNPIVLWNLPDGETMPN